MAPSLPRKEGEAPSKKPCQPKRSRSGCLTCKARRVKCDEGFPVCRRCLQTGRICDGYGMLRGGGGNAYGPRSSRAAASSAPATVVALPLSAGTASLASRAAREHFEWFRCRTAYKLRGTFATDFWTSLLQQAAACEPAPFHAVVALGALHRGGSGGDGGRGSSPVEPFAVQHYLWAIRALQTHFAAGDRAAIRVTLLTCIVFVSLDLLRGHFLAAQTHLDSGLRLLSVLPSPVQDKSDVDDHLIQVFTRLHVQMELFRQPCGHPSRRLREITYGRAITLRPWSLQGAWMALDRALLSILGLQRREEPAAADHTDLETAQKRVQSELARWLAAYEAVGPVLRGGGSSDEDKRSRLLRIYHTMATIMAAVCLETGDEAVYDGQTDGFACLICQLADLWAVSFPTMPSSSFSPPTLSLSGSQGHYTPHFVADMGWIAPLFFVAAKCRVHRIRLQAVRLLESSSHREGVWDSRITACAARQIMEQEEHALVGSSSADDDFLLDSYPQPQDLSLPPLPRECRISNVHICLSGEPLEAIHVLSLTKDRADAHCLAVYKISSQRWESWGCE